MTAPAPVTSASPTPTTTPSGAPALVPATPTGVAPSRTAQQLRRLDTAVAGLGAVFAVAGLISFVLLALALGRAADSTAQLIRVQQLQTTVLAADATATNAFLIGGLEPPAQRAAYDQAIDATSVLIAQAARAEPADELALSRLNEQLVAYASAVEQARANNRQGFPVGAQYLRTASATLRADALPLLDNLVSANSERADSQLDTDEAWLFGALGFAALVGLGLVQFWLARRFHRRFNPPLVTATSIGLVVWVALLVSTAGAGRVVEEVRAGDFAEVNAAATARIRGFDAKSNESLTLIARGSGGAFEKAWTSSAAQVSESLTSLAPEIGRSWNAYASVHREIRTLDDGGRWDEAVQLATSTDPGTSNTTFGAFDRSSAGVVEQAGSSAIGALRIARNGLFVAAVVALASGVAVAIVGRRGVQARLQEYR